MRPTSQAHQLRQLLERHTLLITPGVFDGFSARIAERAGAALVYASGGAIARSMGYPDLGLLSMTEMRDRIAQICAATTVPVIADADTGYGNVRNVIRTVREFGQAGVAALHIEDQVTPKKCGQYAGKELISPAEMCGKVRAAVDNRPDPELVVIARTDAIAVSGLPDALRRAERYAHAGADVLFIEAPQSREQIEEIAQALKGIPLLINMSTGGTAPLIRPKELERMGYLIMIAPSDLQRASQRAMTHAVETLLQEGSCGSIDNQLTPLSERDKIVDTARWDALAAQYDEDDAQPRW